MAPSRRGFCQLIAGGCVLVVLVGALLVGGVGYFFYHHSHSRPQAVLSSSPAAPLTPLALAATASGPPRLTWTGQLACRGKNVPVENYSGVFYVGSLDLAKLLTPAELDRVHRKDGGLLLDQQAMGQVVTVNQAELVPIDPLLPTLGFKLEVDEKTHSIQAAVPAPKPGATATAQP
jgi:hypothetical protein